MSALAAYTVPTQPKLLAMVSSRIGCRAFRCGTSVISTRLIRKLAVANTIASTIMPACASGASRSSRAATACSAVPGIG